MKKDSYWFKHDSTASRDLKMMQIKAIYGYEGVGLFWSIIEVLREQGGYKWQSNQTQILSSILGVENERLTNFIADAKRIGLLIESENYLYSNRLIKDMEVWETKKGNGSKTKAKLKRNKIEIEAKQKHKIRIDKIREDNIPTEIEFLSYCKEILLEKYTPLEFSLKAKYQQWNENKWVDGNGNKIKNWKTKILNTIQYLKPIEVKKKHSSII